MNNGSRSPLDPVWALAALGAIFAFVSTQPIQPQDFWWHLRVGQIVIETGAVPTTDLFSFTAAGSATRSPTGQPYIYQSWLAGLILYGVYRLGGPELVVLGQALAITSAYGLILALCWRISRHARLAALATLLAASVGYGNWNARPQTFSILLFAAFVVILSRYRRGDRAGIGLLPVLMAAWVNLHGAFVLGFALAALTLAGETAKRLARWQPEPLSWRAIGLLAAVTAALPLAMLVNPRGPLIYSYVQSLGTNPTVQGLIVEWQPTDIRTLEGLLFFGLAGLMALLFLLRGQQTDPTDLLVYAAFLWLGLSALRHQIWFGLVAATLLAVYGPAAWATARIAWARRPALKRWLDRPARPAPARPRLNALLAGLILLGMIATLPWCKPFLPLTAAKQGVIAPGTPVQATAFLRASGQPVRLFHAMDYGSYLIWAWPDAPVFADARIELYPEQLWKDYLAITYVRYDWEARLAAWEIDTLMLDRAGQPLLIQAAAASPDWERRYEDETTVIFCRRAQHGL